MADLTSLRFTPLEDSVDRVGLITCSERSVCAVTRDRLSNAASCAVLRPSGAGVTLECVEKLIRKGMVDPVNGDKLTERDIIVLQRVSWWSPGLCPSKLLVSPSGLVLPPPAPPTGPVLPLTFPLPSRAPPLAVEGAVMCVHPPPPRHAPPW